LEPLIKVKPILFCWIDEIIWTSNTQFILVGVDRSYDGYTPLIYLGDTETRSFSIFKSKNKNCRRKDGVRYFSASLKKMKIESLLISIEIVCFILETLVDPSSPGSNFLMVDLMNFYHL